jgi:hypothetical protein
MEAMLGISLYSYPYLKVAKNKVFLIIAYVFSAIKFEIRAKQVLPGSKGVFGKQVGPEGVKPKTMYAYMKKCKFLFVLERSGFPLLLSLVLSLVLPLPLSLEPMQKSVSNPCKVSQ